MARKLAVGPVGRLAEQAAKALKGGDRAQAHRYLHEALAVAGSRHDAEYFSALYLAGVVSAADGQHEGAARIFADVLHHYPDHPMAHFNAGVIALRRAIIAKGEYHLRKSVELAKPPFVPGLINLALVVMAQGRTAEAEKMLAKITALTPRHTADWWHWSHAAMFVGDFKAAWRAWERRWDNADFLGSNRREWTSGERWTGQPVGRKTLYLHAEQGMGDAIQFMGMLPELRAREPDMDLIVEVHPPMVPLLGSLVASRVVDEARAYGADQPPPVDFWAGLGTVPAVLEWEPTPLEAYIRPPSTNHHVPLCGMPRVGVVWQGSIKHNDDAHRSIPVSMFAPLFEAFPDVEWVAFQRDADRHQEWVEATMGCENTIYLNDAALPDFGHTAAWLDTCAAVVTVDTAMVHLAGAMGVPTIMLNRAMTDWRWGLASNPYRWYKSVTEIRQARVREWEPVIQEAIPRLRRLLNP